MGSLIDISAVEAQLEAAAAFTKMEFSGFGWARREKRGEDSVLVVYRVEFMDVGSYGYTQINITPEQLKRWFAEPDYANLKVWFHRHPIEGWSETDESTARKEPMGSTPQMVRWAAAIVRTPTGWTGRIDTFMPTPDGKLDKYGLPGEAIAAEVIPNSAKPVIETMRKICDEKAKEKLAKMADLNIKWQSGANAYSQMDMEDLMEMNDFLEMDGADMPVPDVVCPQCQGEECYEMPYGGGYECSDCGSEFTENDIKHEKEKKAVRKEASFFGETVRTMNDVLDTTRFQGIYQVPAFFCATLIGAGGIGALTAITLGKMGIKDITIFDDDTIDGVNVATQFHMFSDIGKPKVDAVADLVREFSAVHAVRRNQRVTEHTELGVTDDVIISAVDSIKARQAIWKNLVTNRSQGWYIDARMAALELQMFVVDMNNRSAVNDYNRQLMELSEDDVPDVPCTEKATTFLPGLASAQIGASVMRIILGEETSHRFIQNIRTNFVATVKLGQA